MIESTPVKDLPARTVESLSRDLASKQAELNAANDARHAADVAVRRASASNDSRHLPDLNKTAERAGHLVTSLEGQLEFAKQRLRMAERQAASHAAATAPSCAGDRLFEGRKVRHRAGSAAALQAKLEPGYSVTGEIVGADQDGNGGIDAGSLRKWLADNNYGQPVVVLPENGRAGSFERTRQ